MSETRKIRRIVHFDGRPGFHGATLDCGHHVHVPRANFSHWNHSAPFREAKGVLVLCPFCAATGGRETIDRLRTTLTILQETVDSGDLETATTLLRDSLVEIWDLVTKALQIADDLSKRLKTIKVGSERYEENDDG
jgi:hypothetical protein